MCLPIASSIFTSVLAFLRKAGFLLPFPSWVSCSTLEHTYSALPLLPLGFFTFVLLWWRKSKGEEEKKHTIQRCPCPSSSLWYQSWFSCSLRMPCSQLWWCEITGRKILSVPLRWPSPHRKLHRVQAHEKAGWHWITREIFKACTKVEDPTLFRQAYRNVNHLVYHSHNSLAWSVKAKSTQNMCPRPTPGPRPRNPLILGLQRQTKPFSIWLQSLCKCLSGSLGVNIIHKRLLSRILISLCKPLNQASVSRATVTSRFHSTPHF